MALGALVFSPLGPAWLPAGILAGITALAMANLGALIRGGPPFLIHAPYSLSAVLLLGTLGTLLAQSAPGAAPETALALLFLAVALAGLLQVLFGLLGLGGVAKFIPYPVLAGLLDGSAALILLSQAAPLLGLPAALPWSELGHHLGEVSPLAPAVAAVALLAIHLGGRSWPQVPAPFIGLLAGSGCHHLLAALGYGAALGPLVGEVPGGLPTPHYLAGLLAPFGSPGGVGRMLAPLGTLLPAIAGLAAINSLRTVVVCNVAEHLAEERFDANRALIGQGFGNLLAGVFGGIGGAGGLPESLANHRYGGRTARSRLAAGAAALLIPLALYPLLAAIPQGVLAAILVAATLGVFDTWSLRLPGRALAARREGDYGPLIDLALVASVVLVLLAAGIFQALAVGLLISVAWFIVRMGKSVIRAEYRVGELHSNTWRAQGEVELLLREGGRIRLLELEGALFFGTADRLARRVDELLDEEVEQIVLDFYRVGDVDTTGARLVAQLAERCGRRGVPLHLCHLDEDGRHHRELARQLAGLPGARPAASREEGLAAAEDGLLDRLLGPDRYRHEIPLAESGLAAGMDEAERAVLLSYLERLELADGAVVFRQGEPGDALYLIVRARARVVLRLDGGHERLLGNLCTGTLFGEMALLDGSPRSADVRALGPLTCYRLSRDAVDRLTRDHPRLAVHLLAGLGRELSLRLRYANSNRAAR
ncbi:hypothetical protein JCM17961_31140 [Endothiovibrio diazotrophicus]